MGAKKKIFLTGATGIVGSYLLKILLRNNCKVYALVRKIDNKDIRNRVLDILKFWGGKDLKDKLRNLTVFEGDITKEGLGLNKATRELLITNVEEIFHCAAITEFNWSLKDIRKVNTDGVRNILDFGIQCSKNSRFKKINHLSTVYICGNSTGNFKETDFDKGQQFNTSYEQSKFEAEKVIERFRRKGLWIDIFRPPLVIGESKTGRIFSFRQSFYQILHLWNLEIFSHFPGKDCFITVVFVDELCESIFKIAFSAFEKNNNYHPFTQKTISLEKILNIASAILKFKKPKIDSFHQFLKRILTPTQKIILKNNILSFNRSVTLNSYNTNILLKKYGLQFSNLNQTQLSKLIIYAEKRGYLKRHE